MKLFNIVGARPQIIKSAAISRAIKKHNEIDEFVIHSGQHYDTNMSEVFFNEMGIPKPSINLKVGSGSHGLQTAKMLTGFEEQMILEKPDVVLVYGDTNSTLAAALAASKLQIPVAHVEAGLRSFNKNMPEEINRILTDNVSTLLFTPTETGLKNLKREGFDINQKSEWTNNQPGVFNFGDVMFDNTLYYRNVANDKYDRKKKDYILLTVHRDFNTDDKEKLTSIINAIEDIAIREQIDVIFPAHPRVRIKLKEFGISCKNITLIEPVSFLEMTFLESNASYIITDSGGVQKEAFFMQKPCVVLREETEWVEIVDSGEAILTGSVSEKILNAFQVLKDKTTHTFNNFYGNGSAADQILDVLLRL